MSLAAFVGAVGCFVRIQEFLNKEERKDQRKNPMDYIEELSQMGTPTIDSPATFAAEKQSVRTNSTASSTILTLGFKGNQVKHTSSDVVIVQDSCFGWEDNEKPLLKNISIRVPRQKLTILVGPVGCGKSTLLKALLGEIPAISGTVQMSSHSVAFCDQSPWHMNETIQQGIIGISKFDPRWYATVVRACALDQDMLQLSEGDQTIIGSKGIALSGGQSQRIVSISANLFEILFCASLAKLSNQALARAVYAQKEVLIIDDALSGLDATTENHVFHNLWGNNGILRSQKVTVIIASSSS